MANPTTPSRMESPNWYCWTTCWNISRSGITTGKSRQLLLRVLLYPTLVDAVQVLAGLLDRDPLFQQTDRPGAEPAVTPFGVGTQRLPNLLGFGEIRLRRKHPDDRVGIAIQHQRPTEDGRVVSELPLPEAEAQQSHVRPALPVFLRREVPAQDRTQAQYPEEIMRRQAHVDPFGLVAERKVGRPEGTETHALEGLVVLPPSLETGKDLHLSPVLTSASRRSTIRSWLGTGNGRRNRPLKRLKIVVMPATPTARIPTIINENAG